MSLGILFQIVAYFVLGAAVLSAIFWIGLSYTWWKMERKRIKKGQEITF